MTRERKSNRKFPQNFQKVVDWMTETKHIRVELAKRTSFMGHVHRVITVHHNYNLNKNGLYALLHECGHAHQPPTTSGVNSYKLIDMDEKPKQFKMGRFLNEVDAWDRGLEISKLLNIPIDIKEWESIKQEALLTYFV